MSGTVPQKDKSFFGVLHALHIWRVSDSRTLMSLLMSVGPYPKHMRHSVWNFK